MTTADPTDQVSPPDQPFALPDLQELAALANSYFRSLPSQPPASGAGGGPELEVPAYSRPDAASLAVPAGLPLSLGQDLPVASQPSSGSHDAPLPLDVPQPADVPLALDLTLGGRLPATAADLGVPTDAQSVAATQTGSDPQTTPVVIPNPITLEPAAGAPDPSPAQGVGQELGAGAAPGGGAPTAAGASPEELAAIAAELADSLAHVADLPKLDLGLVGDAGQLPDPSTPEVPAQGIDDPPDLDLLLPLAAHDPAAGLPDALSTSLVADHFGVSGLVPAAIPLVTGQGDWLAASEPQPGTPTAAGLPPDTATSSLSVYEFHPQMMPSLAGTPVTARPFDPHAIRRDFPILSERVHGRPLIWLDNGATTQKPQQVIDRISHYYAHENSNIHRAAHTLAARSTDAYEGARDKVRRFLNASSASEIVFVRGATEGINLVANTWGQANVGSGDEILITHLEHHANIVPWQQLAQRTGAVLKVAPVDDSGQIILSEFTRLVSRRTRLVAVTQVSNALGTITPVAEMIDIAHRQGAIALVDAAQSVLHMRVDVAALDADFLVFSGHKMFAPTGIGAVYGKAGLWADTPPWQGGGNMIADVTFERTVYQPPPNRFEAGTGNIADAVGLGAAIDYLSAIGLENVAAYEHELLEYATAGLLTIPGLRLIGTAHDKAGVLSFVLAGHDPVEVGAQLDGDGIAVRAGHHCAQPILRRFGVEATVRPSLAMYNLREEIDCLVDAVRRIQAGGPARI